MGATAVEGEGKGANLRYISGGTAGVVTTAAQILLAKTAVVETA